MKRSLLKYFWIINTIRRKEEITLSDLSEIWKREDINEYKEPLSPSTFHRNRNEIYDLFDIEIKRTQQPFLIDERFSLLGKVKSLLLLYDKFYFK